MANHGCLGQLVEDSQLVLAADPGTVSAGGSSRLSGMATLDDGTFLALGGSGLVWAAPVLPIVSISAAGVATAGSPMVSRPGSTSGSYRSVSAAVTITVLPPVPTAARLAYFVAGRTRDSGARSRLLLPASLVSRDSLGVGGETVTPSCPPMQQPA